MEGSLRRIRWLVLPGLGGLEAKLVEQITKAQLARLGRS
jgi:hypothetical protein